MKTCGCRFNLISVLITASGVLWVVKLIVSRCPKLDVEQTVHRKTTRHASATCAGMLAKITRSACTVATGVASIFPALLLLTAVRFFAFESFVVVSRSMAPNLLSGDLILVKKFAYGIRNPVGDKPMIRIKDPSRGDVIVFRYPPKPEFRYVKRVIGLPGDVVTYNPVEGKIAVKIVEDRCAETNLDHGNTPPQDARRSADNFSRSSLGKLMYPDEDQGSSRLRRERGESCHGETSGITCRRRSPVDRWKVASDLPARWLIPSGNYFVVGDNVDSSCDSRFWGFVPEGNILGKVVGIWMSVDASGDSSWSRFSLRLNRIGPIDHNLHTAILPHGSIAVMASPLENR